MNFQPNIRNHLPALTLHTGWQLSQHLLISFSFKRKTILGKMKN